MDEQQTTSGMQISADTAQNNNQTVAGVETVFSSSNPLSDETEIEYKKRMEAILAMEGEEGKLKRELETKERKNADEIVKLKKEEDELKSKIAEIEKEKVSLELKWVGLSDKKNELKKILEPILTMETKLEKDEHSKNQEEHATDDTKLVHGFEKERHQIANDRQKVEQNKWIFEDKIAELDKEMSENKTKYQTLLGEESTHSSRVKEIELNIDSLSH